MTYGVGFPGSYGYGPAIEPQRIPPPAKPTQASFSVDVPSRIPLTFAAVFGGGTLLSDLLRGNRSVADSVGHASATGLGAMLGTTISPMLAAGRALDTAKSRAIRSPTDRTGMTPQEAAELLGDVQSINLGGVGGVRDGAILGAIGGGSAYDSLTDSEYRGVPSSARQTLTVDPETISAAEVIQRKTSSWPQTLAVLGGGALAGVLGGNVGHAAGLAAAPLFPGLDPDTLARAGTFAVGVPSAHLGALLTGAAMRPEIAKHVTAANLPRIAAGVYDPASNREQEAADAFGAKRKGELVA